MLTADEVIKKLNLSPHPLEGGYFRETYRSGLELPATVLPNQTGPRSASTAIYYLLKPGQVSELHVLPGDEVFHFYFGQPVKMLQLHPSGSGVEIILGHDLKAGHLPQVVVPGGIWQGTQLLGNEGFALLGCTVAPGFDYADYKSTTRAEALASWPNFAATIEQLTPRG